MTDTTKYFLHILNCFVCEKSPQAIPENIDWEELLELSEIHCVQGIIWVVLSKTDITEVPEIVKKNLNKGFVSSVKISIEQEIALEQIKKKLNESGVQHVMMKGSVIKKCYPVKELRTMGDIDYLINEESREICHKAMLDLGYTPLVKGASVWEYKGKLAYVEVHNKIIYQKLFLGIDYTQYFSDVFDNLIQISENTYEMVPEYHLVYIIVHLSKHLYRVGCGVRMIMDIPVFINYYKDSINWDSLKARLKEIKMWEFTQNLLYLCVKYFDCKLPDNVYKENDEIAEKLMEYIISAGVFGRYKRNEYEVKFGTENANKTGLKKVLGKVKTVFKMVFPDYKTMCGWYGWFDGKPKWMLPWGWCKRAYLQVRYKNNMIKDKLSGVLTDSDESKEHYKIMSMIGLIK